MFRRSKGGDAIEVYCFSIFLNCKIYHSITAQFTLVPLPAILYSILSLITFNLGKCNRDIALTIAKMLRDTRESFSEKYESAWNF